ncbi:helix-turn-helix transcriptional regulator [Natrinema sp. DC36]|uniref:helix-turn-helix transcriptional regulator n=1 Tax=Natrinema sp. DC36 TaxID=2878680 RepID=UPI001CF0B8BB|nr:helix-turn-helix transcriptional regulator [Natrinema sp. DC36]
MSNLTTFQCGLLFVIAWFGPAKGLKIKDKLSDYYAKGINHGQLYPNFDTLVDRRLVEKGSMDRRTNSYKRTARAKQELENQREWELVVSREGGRMITDILAQVRIQEVII